MWLVSVVVGANSVVDECVGSATQAPRVDGCDGDDTGHSGGDDDVRAHVQVRSVL